MCIFIYDERNLKNEGERRARLRNGGEKQERLREGRER